MDFDETHSCFAHKLYRNYSSPGTKALQKTEFSELFVFASFGIVQLLKFGNFSEISSLFELAKILQKQFGHKFTNNFLFFEAKTGVFGSKQGFPNIPKFQKVQNLFYSRLSKNYKKMMLKPNFGNCKKLVPTQIPTRTFEFKLGMQGLTWNCKWDAII